jgi:hypothetical protein
MVTLNIDEETFAAWREQAEARGMSVEEWLKAKTADEAPASKPRGRKKKKEMSDEEWNGWLQSFIDRHRPTGRPVDDSRESIYD